jgi:hypothetical protein
VNEETEDSEMADTKTRDATLAQYLNEAYGNEKELERVVLQPHGPRAAGARETDAATIAT